MPVIHQTVYAGRAPAAPEQRGVMLLEALISIAIFSIGILGLLALQSAAIRNANEARQRAAAAFYVNQIVGEMWSDERSNLSGYAHYASGEASSAQCAFSGTSSTNAKVSGWIELLARDLNGAAGGNRQQIRIGTDNVVSVTVCWKNPEETAYHWFSSVAQIQG